MYTSHIHQCRHNRHKAKAAKGIAGNASPLPVRHILARAEPEGAEPGREQAEKGCFPPVFRHPHKWVKMAFNLP